MVKYGSKSYERGKPLTCKGTSDKKGITVTLNFDQTNFSALLEYNYDTLATRMRELSFLNKGITINA